MSTHLSKSQLERFSVGALQDDEMASAARHMADCESCHQGFVEELRRRLGPEPIRFSLDWLEPEFHFRHDHFEYDELIRWAKGTLDSEYREIRSIHLRTCKRCREDICIAELIEELSRTI